MSKPALTHAWPNLDPKDRRRFVTQAERAAAVPAWIVGAFADLLPEPDPRAGLDAQLLHGEIVSLLETRDGWARVQAARNGYVGWVAAGSIAAGNRLPTHRVAVPRSFLYGEADMKKPRTGCLSLGSELVVTGETETRGTRYALIDSGEAVIAGHLAPVEQSAEDYVAVAETLLRTPYLWGGDTAFGLDCAGLVSLSMKMAGMDVLRDSDLQAATIGGIVDPGDDWSDIRRGDLVFWPGHVAIVQGEIDGAVHILHANGHTMDVASEPLEGAIARIAHLYQQPIGVRRPDAAQTRLGHGNQ